MGNKNLPAVAEKNNEVAPYKEEKKSLHTRWFLRKIKMEEKREELVEKKTSRKAIVHVSSKEEKVIRKANHKFWKILAVGCIVLMVVIVVACLIDIFNFVRGFFNDALMGNIVAGSVVGVLVIILGIVVIRPIVVALSTPVFTLDIVDDADKKKISRKNFKKLQQVAKNIIKTNDNVSEHSKNLLSTFIGNKKELNNTLKTIYDTEIAKDIQNTINETATKVLVTTAVSQNEKFDAASVIILNIRMIMKICVKCGYHPTYARLSKLIVKVFRNSLLAASFQSILGKGVESLVDLLVKIPGVGVLASSFTQGSMNALLTLRIGIITRKYLYEEYNIQAMIDNPDEIEAEIVESALEEANGNIGLIVEEYKKGLKNR